MPALAASSSRHDVTMLVNGNAPCSQSESPIPESAMPASAGGGAVTALAAFASRHNATTLVSGHVDGRVRTHAIELRPARSGNSGCEF